MTGCERSGGQFKFGSPLVVRMLQQQTQLLRTNPGREHFKELRNSEADALQLLESTYCLKLLPRNRETLLIFES